jgi:hypothetical protein
MPYEPGIYVALVTPDAESQLLETQSVSSQASSSVRLSRSKSDARVFLDLTSLPAKIQLILTKFEMIVIGTVKSIREDNSPEESKEIETILSSTMQYCSINVEQLIALQDL